MTAPAAAEILNLVGFATGTVLYGMLLALLLQQSAREAPRRITLSLVTAVLGLVWNIGEIAAYALPRLGHFENSIALWAVSFPALGLLAAVVVHTVARDLPGGWGVIRVGYGASLVASVLHTQTVIAGDPAPSQFAFVLLTLCYIAIIATLAVMTRRQANNKRALWLLALTLFAVSASHLGRFHLESETWQTELIGHHASIPLAFAILYQDYRFALMDRFLKRALTLTALVGLAFGGYALFGSLPPGPFSAGLLLAMWVATGLLAPALRYHIRRFVDSKLLGRPDYQNLPTRVAMQLQAEDTIDGVLGAVCRILAPTLSAETRWYDTRALQELPLQYSTTRAVVPTTEEPRYVIAIGALTGGRRLLSDDISMIEAVAGHAARRIDQIRLLQERYATQLREEEMLKLTAEAELKALRAQINPHFLFNALTTIGYLIDAAPRRALATLLQLTALLRGVLHSDGEFTTLGRELDLIEHYLKIEQERFEERLQVSIHVPEALRMCRVPALVIQPLVENAIKHGVTPSVTGGSIDIVAALRGTGDHRVVRLTVQNTGGHLPVSHGSLDQGHLGLDNVRRRLVGHYGSAATLDLFRADDGSTIAQITLPLDAAAQDVGNDAAVANRFGRR